jgi:hypothetical protein
MDKSMDSQIAFGAQHVTFVTLTVSREPVPDLPQEPSASTKSLPVTTPAKIKG